MAALSRAEFERYCEKVDRAVESCKSPSRVKDVSVLAYRMMNQEVPIESRHAARIKIAEMARALYVRSCMGQASAVDDYTESQFGYRPVAAEYDLPEEQILEQIGYYAKDFKEPEDAHVFADRLLSWVSKKSEDVANEKMTENARAHEKKTGKKVKFAYVPVEIDICGFCCMMAGRGFEFSASASDKLHDHCKCKKMPNSAGDDIPWYNHEDYYQRYKTCSDTVSATTTYEMYEKSGSEEPYNDWKTSQIVAEMERRSTRWLATGEIPEITFETEDLRNEKFSKKYEHEIRTANRIRKYGFATDFVIDEIHLENGKVIGLADLKSGLEIKSLSNANTFSTVDGYLRNTSRKRNANAVVFDNVENASLPDADLIEMLRKSRRFKNGRVYVITKDKAIVLIR